MSEDHEHIPVLIVGGGPGGLTASLLLSRLGIRSLLVERREGTSELPKAHILNQRTMEILDVCGVADEVYEQGSPAEFGESYLKYFRAACRREGLNIVSVENIAQTGQEVRTARAQRQAQG